MKLGAEGRELESRAETATMLIFAVVLVISVGTVLSVAIAGTSQSVCVCVKLLVRPTPPPRRPPLARPALPTFVSTPLPSL